MFSAQATASSSALCASIGPSRQSPIAQMPGDIGLVMRVGDDAAARVELHADLVEAELVRIRTAPDGDEHDVGLDHLLLAAGGRLDGDA